VAWRLADTLAGYLFMRMHAVDWQVVAEAGWPRPGPRVIHVPRPPATSASPPLARGMGDNQRATDHFTHALKLAVRAGWLDCRASALSNLGLLSWIIGQPEQAITHYTQALAIARQTGRFAAQATNLRRLGLANWGLGRGPGPRDRQRAERGSKVTC
jgi:hypothetical protein